MAGYTIVNMMELENRAVEGGSTLDARFSRSALNSDHLGVSHFRYAPGPKDYTVTWILLVFLGMFGVPVPAQQVTEERGLAAATRPGFVA